MKDDAGIVSVEKAAVNRALREVESAFRSAIEETVPSNQKAQAKKEFEPFLKEFLRPEFGVQMIRLLNETKTNNKKRNDPVWPSLEENIYEALMRCGIDRWSIELTHFRQIYAEVQGKLQSKIEHREHEILDSNEKDDVVVKVENFDFGTKR